MVISNPDAQVEEVLLNAVEIQPQFGTSSHEDHYWYCAVIGGVSQESNVDILTMCMSMRSSVEYASKIGRVLADVQVI